MHMVIRILVPAKTKQEALDAARTEFDNITGEGKPFDYFTMFDEEGSTVSGKGRYGNVPSALKVSTKAGKAMVDEGMASTKREFMDKLSKIKLGLATFTDEELFNGDAAKDPRNMDCYLFRHFCYGAGQYAGGSVWLYDRFGSGIQSEKDLARVLAEKLDDGNQLWVVPADVHF